MPTWNPVTFTQNAWQATNAVARGDLALVVGTRSHWTLHAQLVLFGPLSAADVGDRRWPHPRDAGGHPDRGGDPLVNPVGQPLAVPVSPADPAFRAGAPAPRPASPQTP